MSNSSSKFTPPTLADVERIAAQTDSVVRNLQITQCYHELSVALFARTGLHANWCTFATWASRQAGQSIRKEDLRRFLQSMLESSSATYLAVDNTAGLAQRLGAKSSRMEIRQEVWKQLDLSRVVDHTSQAVARGNLKVFEEIGYEFARFCAACLADSAPDADNIARFCSTLRSGDPPDGQDSLRRAFTHLYAAFFEPDLSQRAQLMFLSNLLIGYHEQTRLQPEILAALDAPFLDGSTFVQRLLEALFPLTSRLILQARALAYRLLKRPLLLEMAVRVLLQRAQMRLHQAITDMMMTISFPNGLRLRLGRDLAGTYPECLQQITYLDLCTLLEKIDPTPDSLRDSGALDWSNLPDRLHFILELFRLYHQDRDLFEPPFSAQQVAALKAGRLPDGDL